ncbi:hypothetical protein SteCoe_32881 [Stentor coeruleus]|uniref:Uncharacterized protein n=1 Tax=Stentor coeruleus TaxID=5963 RepID=A0A1R2AY32_9CILI|nr:hypothetical protein SteCoe_32881 [Stentor coeruleus]
MSRISPKKSFNTPLLPGIICQETFSGPGNFSLTLNISFFQLLIRYSAQKSQKIVTHFQELFNSKKPEVFQLAQDFKIESQISNFYQIYHQITDFKYSIPKRLKWLNTYIESPKENYAESLEKGMKLLLAVVLKEKDDMIKSIYNDTEIYILGLENGKKKIYSRFVEKLPVIYLKFEDRETSLLYYKDMLEVDSIEGFDSIILEDAPFMMIIENDPPKNFSDQKVPGKYCSLPNQKQNSLKMSIKVLSDFPNASQDSIRSISQKGFNVNPNSQQIFLEGSNYLNIKKSVEISPFTGVPILIDFPQPNVLNPTKSNFQDISASGFPQKVKNPQFNQGFGVKGSSDKCSNHNKSDSLSEKPNETLIFKRSSSPSKLGPSSAENKNLDLKNQEDIQIDKKIPLEAPKSNIIHGYEEKNIFSSNNCPILPKTNVEFMLPGQIHPFPLTNPQLELKKPNAIHQISQFPNIKPQEIQKNPANISQNLEVFNPKPLINPQIQNFKPPALNQSSNINFPFYKPPIPVICSKNPETQAPYHHANPQTNPYNQLQKINNNEMVPLPPQNNPNSIPVQAIPPNIDCSKPPQGILVLNPPQPYNISNQPPSLIQVRKEPAPGISMPSIINNQELIHGLPIPSSDFIGKSYCIPPNPQLIKQSHNYESIVYNESQLYNNQIKKTSTPENRRKTCINCNRLKEIEEFKTVECENSKDACQICSYCRVKDLSHCIVCSRKYYESEIDTLSIITLNKFEV